MFFHPSYLILFIYVLVLLGFAAYHKKKDQNTSDFFLGERKMGFIVTALAAHASDMSSWIFIGYPAQVYTNGTSSFWLAVGLILFMMFNWLLVAKKLRINTAHFENLTLFSYFECITRDSTGSVRTVSSLMSTFFYTIYISAGLMGLGLLLENLLHIPYFYSLTLGAVAVVPFLWIGGYVTLAWADLFQGIFLILVLSCVPLIAFLKIDGIFPKVVSTLTGFIPDSTNSLVVSLGLFLSWGLGYFGQPHILTKFMGIKNPDEIPKSMCIGILWQTVALIGSTLVGIIGMILFKNLADPQKVFFEVANLLTTDLFFGFTLCAIIGVTITSMGAQVLIVATTLSEDIYKKMIFKEANVNQILKISRLSIIGMTLVAFFIAATKPANLFDLVSVAWFGLGGAFGPLVLCSLWKKTIKPKSALLGIVSGSSLTMISPIFFPKLPALALAFLISITLILLSDTKKTSSEEL